MIQYLLPQDGNNMYIPPETNKRAITTTIAAVQTTITEDMAIVFLNSPYGKVFSFRDTKRLVNKGE